LSELITG